MTDLKMIIACAEAMGKPPHEPLAIWEGEGIYNPLKNDEQAMALVKRFILSVSREHHGDRWGVGKPWPEAFNADLNRAIVECVSKMQQAKPC